MKPIISFVLLFGIYLPLFAQLQITVESIPDNTPPGASIYIAGNFNGWDPENSDFILSDNGDGSYFISLSIAPGLVEFKFTRGGWDTVEGNATGGFLPNRTFNYSGGLAEETIEILSWEDLGSGSGMSTAADNVSILSEDFYMPELDRNRRIWLYLPPDYDTSLKSYPVLYMQDGQNVFDDLTSFAGEWKVDESLNDMFENGDYGCIVVGIDNGGVLRLDEYSPWVNMVYGGGEGDEYVEFIVNTLKPYIDDNYRTLPEREHTGLMGSSMGGLISHYAAIEYQYIFSKAGVFSPSFWFSNEAYVQVETIGKLADMRIYYLIGENEWDTGVSDMAAMYNTCLDSGFTESELQFLTHEDGAHSEWYWAREFGPAYLWLYDSLSVVGTSSEMERHFSFYPNPASEWLQIWLEGYPYHLTLELLDLRGKCWLKETVSGNTRLSLNGVPQGMYILNVVARDGESYHRKVVVEK